MLIKYHIAVHYIYHIYINQCNTNIMLIILVKIGLFLDNLNRWREMLSVSDCWICNSDLLILNKI